MMPQNVHKNNNILLNSDDEKERMSMTFLRQVGDYYKVNCILLRINM